MNPVEKFKQALDERVAAWEKLGVLVGGDRVPRAMQKLVHGEYIPHPTTINEDRTINQIIARTASQMKRPYVTVWERKEIDYSVDPPVISRGVWEFNIPNTKRCAVLSAPLLLVAAPRDTRRGFIETYDQNGKLLNDPVPHPMKMKRYNLTIEDKNISERWLERCRDDELFRVALGTLQAGDRRAG